MKYFFSMFFLIIQTSNYEALELNDYIEKINNGYQIIDVRTQSEFAHGHIPSAINLDFYDSTFVTEINNVEVEEDGKTPKDTRYDCQKESLLAVLRTLKAMYPDAQIHGHRDFARKACPSFDATEEYKHL